MISHHRLPFGPRVHNWWLIKNFNFLISSSFNLFRQQLTFYQNSQFDELQLVQKGLVKLLVRPLNVLKFCVQLYKTTSSKFEIVLEFVQELYLGDIRRNICLTFDIILLETDPKGRNFKDVTRPNMFAVCYILRNWVGRFSRKRHRH